MDAAHFAPKFDFNRVACGQVALNVASIGAGRPLVFLHGFPEHWRAFEPMMIALHDQFECIAPDQRGYGLSDRPLSAGAYHIDLLVGDVAGLIKALGHSKVDIVAHDWGGLVGWHFAGLYPELVERLVIFNAPHPYCFQAALDRDPEQRAASSYAAQFSKVGAHHAFDAQAPQELWNRFFARDMAMGFLDQHDMAEQMAMWQEPHAWETMLNWYQAGDFDFTGTCTAKRKEPSPIGIDTLLVWGNRDPLFRPCVLDGLASIAPLCTLKTFPDCGHAVFRERPTQSAALVRAFLANTPPKKPMIA